MKISNYYSENEERKKFPNFVLPIMVVVFLFVCSCDKYDDKKLSSNNPYNDKTTAVFNPAVNYGTMTDQDGNIYKTVTIGTQTWMAENLRTSKYNDGKAIPIVTNYDEWSALTTGAYSNYNNTTNPDTIATYGRLYNWHAVNTGKLAPNGWHVATDSEWTILMDYLGGKSVSGGKLKETGIWHWNTPNKGGTNETGFTALPGGYRYNIGIFNFIGNSGFWWTATEESPISAMGWNMGYNYSDMYNANGLKELGVSVRCVMD